MLDFLQNKIFLYFLALVNLVAGIYSLSFYSTQLSQSNPLLWVFIADCPLAAILFALNIFLIARGIKLPWLSFLSIMASVKFALWTIFVLIISNNLFSLWWIFLVHILLLIETIVLLGLFNFRVKHVLIALILFSIGDYFDYVLGTHPPLLNNIFVLAGLFAIILTIFLSFLLPLIFSSSINSKSNAFSVPVKRKGKWSN
jgi:uncharacterized membrane protein YpjA